MKTQRKAKWVLVSALAIVMTLCISIAAACSTVNEVKLASLGLDVSSVEKDFYVDDEFTYEGLIVTAYYSDETSKEVTDYTVQAPDMTTAGTKPVIVTYKSVQAQYDVTVYANSVSDVNTDTYEVGAPIVKYVYDEAAVAVEGANNLNGEDLTLSAVAADGYSVTKVTAKVDGKEVSVAEADDTYTIPSDVLTGNTVVTVATANDGVDEAAYKVNYYSQNGDLLANYGYNSEADALYQPAAQKYYTFNGWTDAEGNAVASLSDVEEGEINLIQNLSLNAEEVANNLTVTVKDGEGKIDENGYLTVSAIINIGEDLITDLVDNETITAIGLVLTNADNVEYTISKENFSTLEAPSGDSGIYNGGKSGVVSLKDSNGMTGSAYAYGYGWANYYGLLTVTFKIKPENLKSRYFTPWVITDNQDNPIVGDSSNNDFDSTYTVTVNEVKFQDGNLVVSGTATGYVQSLELALHNDKSLEVNLRETAEVNDGSFSVTFDLEALTLDDGQWYLLYVSVNNGDDTEVSKEGLVLDSSKHEYNDRLYYFEDQWHAAEVVVVVTSGKILSHTITDADLKLGDDNKPHLIISGTVNHTYQKNLEMAQNALNDKIQFEIQKNGDAGDWSYFWEKDASKEHRTVTIDEDSNFTFEFDISSLTNRATYYLHWGDETQVNQDTGHRLDLTFDGYQASVSKYIETDNGVYELVDMGASASLGIKVSDQLEPSYKATSVAFEVNESRDKIYLLVGGTSIKYSQDELKGILDNLYFDLQSFCHANGDWDGDWNTYKDYEKTVSVSENGEWSIKYDITALPAHSVLYNSLGFVIHLGGQDGAGGKNDPYRIMAGAVSFNSEPKVINFKKYTFITDRFEGLLGIGVESGVTIASTELAVQDGKAVMVIKGNMPNKVDQVYLATVRDGGSDGSGNYDTVDHTSEVTITFDDNGNFTATWDLSNLSVGCQYWIHFTAAGVDLPAKTVINPNENIEANGYKYSWFIAEGNNGDNSPEIKVESV